MPEHSFYDPVTSERASLKLEAPATHLLPKGAVAYLSFRGTNGKRTYAYLTPEALSFLQSSKPHKKKKKAPYPCTGLYLVGGKRPPANYIPGVGNLLLSRGIEHEITIDPKFPNRFFCNDYYADNYEWWFFQYINPDDTK